MIKKYFQFYSEYLKIFIKEQIIGAVILVIYSLSNIIYPYFFKLIIDDAISNKNLSNLLSYTIYMSLFIAITTIFKYIKILYFFNFGKKISISIINNIISNLFKYNNRFFRNIKVGEIISILDQDVASIQNLFTNIFNNIIVNILTFFGLSIIIAKLNWKLYLASFFISLIYVLIQHNIGKKLKFIFYMISIKRGEFQALSHEIVSNISNIQLHNKTCYFKKKYISEYINFYDFRYEGVKKRAKSTALDTIFEGANLIAVLLWGGYLVLNNNLSVGSLFTLTLYIQKLFTPMTSLVNNFIEIKKIQASIDRIFEILHCEKNLVKSGSVSVIDNATITVNKMSFTYKDNYLFNNINIKIKPGDKIALVGENGSGKSTLMNIISKLEDKYEGYILLDLYNVEDINSKIFYDTILFIRQDPFVFSGTILENLVMGVNDITLDEIYGALLLVNLKNDVDSMENGINTFIGEKGIKLSGGQKQKLALARIFLRHNYPIIILDEPTAALDKETEELVLYNIFQRKKNSTIIIITHRESVLKYCSKIYYVRNKKVVYDIT